MGFLEIIFPKKFFVWIWFHEKKSILLINAYFFFIFTPNYYFLYMYLIIMRKGPTFNWNIYLNDDDNYNSHMNRGGGTGPVLRRKKWPAVENNFNEMIYLLYWDYLILIWHTTGTIMVCYFFNHYLGGMKCHCHIHIKKQK